MAFSKIADTSFSWEISGFQETTVDSLKEKSYSSRKIATSAEPRREFSLILTVKKNQTTNSGNNCRYCDRSPSQNQKMVNIQLTCSNNTSNPEDLKFHISIKKDEEEVTRTFTIHGNELEYNFNNIMDCETMLKMVKNEKLRLFVCVFLKIEEIESADVTSNLEFLTDFKICIQDEIFEAHKVSQFSLIRFYFYPIPFLLPLNH